MCFTSPLVIVRQNKNANLQHTCETTNWWYDDDVAVQRTVHFVQGRVRVGQHDCRAALTTVEIKYISSYILIVYNYTASEMEW